MKFRASLIFIALLYCTPLRAEIVADLLENYQDGTFPDGWKYQWNENGVVGDAKNYVDLKPCASSGSWWTPDGLSEFPETDSGFLNLQKPVRNGLLTGHTGLIKPFAKFVIFAFSVSTAGEYSIVESCLQNLGGDQATGLELKVYVNDDEKNSMSTEAGNDNPINFDGSVGQLKAGDTIYVAIGPGKNPNFDSFGIRYQISKK